MSEFLNAAFHRSWFGPFPYSDYYGRRRRGIRIRNPYFAFNQGPFDGPLEAGIRAGSFPMAFPPSRRFMGQNDGGPVFCPPGHMPIQTGIPGESRCIFYSPPGAMIGPTPRTTVSTTTPPAFPTGRTFPVGPYWGWKGMSGARARLGQAETLSRAERDRVVAALTSTSAKMRALEDLVSYAVDHDFGLERTLGADAERFYGLWNSAGAYWGTAETVLDRLADPDPESWSIEPEELDEAEKWRVAVGQMDLIVAAHRHVPLELPPGIPSPPGFTKAYPQGSTPPVGRPSGAGPMRPSEQPSGGPTTGDLLLGAGIALGAGLLIAALVS